jgi:hypothetical protein
MKSNIVSEEEKSRLKKLIMWLALNIGGILEKIGGEKKMEDKSKITMMAIGVLGALEAMAMVLGIDGMLFSAVVAAIAGLAGYELKASIEAAKEAD